MNVKNMLRFSEYTALQKGDRNLKYFLSICKKILTLEILAQCVYETRCAYKINLFIVHSNFSWTILSKGERHNGDNPMLNNNP